MEEKDNKTQEKLSYEQLEKVAIQLQNRAIIAENRLKGIDFAMTRLTWLFKVLEHKESFPIKFAYKCAEEITTLLTIEEPTEDKENKENKEK